MTKPHPRSIGSLKAKLAARWAWPQRALWLVIIVLVVCMAGLNIALNLPQSQTRINQLKPEQFLIQWQKAWTLWPGRIQFHGVRASGQTSSIGWAFESERVDISINLMALSERLVEIASLSVISPTYRQVDLDASELSLENRQDDRFGDSGTHPWNIQVDDASISGVFTLETPQLSGQLTGYLSADVRYGVEGYLLEIVNGDADLMVESLLLDESSRVIDRGSLRGSFSLGPYALRDHPGMQSLGFLTVASELAFDTDTLEFLAPYLQRFRDLALTGGGHVEGQIHLGEGRFQPGSRLIVDAPNLAMSLLGFSVDGSGQIALTLDETRPEQTLASIRFDKVRGYSEDRQKLLIEGENLRIEALAPSAIAVNKETLAATSAVKLILEKVVVPEIAEYQRYVPWHIPLRLIAGSGQLSCMAELDPAHAAGECLLKADQATIGFRELKVDSGLELILKARVDSLDSTSINLAGTAIHILETGLSGADSRANTGNRFSTSLVVEQGKLDLDGGQFIDGARRWKEFVRTRDVDAMLINAGADLKLVGKVSSLAWLNELITNPYNLALNGSGAVSLEAKLREGRLQPGSRIEIKPEDLEVALLEYLITGQGGIELAATGRPESLNIALGLEVNDGRFGRKSDTDSHAEVEQILLEASASGVGVDRVADNMRLRLQIPRAKVHDMQVYNAYLPDGAPLRFDGGEATLAVDLTLEPASATGSVDFQTSGLKATLDDQSVEAELGLQVTIVGGQPAAMQFDVSGSLIRIDRVKVDGKAIAFDGNQSTAQAPWEVELVLDKAVVDWKTPLQVQAEASLSMSDTRPMVAIFANNRGKNGWLEKLLTIDDVSGNAVLAVTDRKITVPRMMIGNEDVQVGAKAAFEGTKRAGVVYARYKKLHGLLKFSGRERNFDVLLARKQFDRFDASNVVLVESVEAADQPKRNQDLPWDEAFTNDD